MAASGVASDIAVGFEWTPFSHGFVFWEYPEPDHLPPADEAGQREGLEGFLQAHADYPVKPIRLPTSLDFPIKSIKFKKATMIDFVGLYRLVGEGMR